MKSLEAEDMVPMLRMAADDRIKKTYMLSDLPDREQAEAFFRRLKTLSESDSHFVYGIYRDGDLIGFLNECEIDGTNIELGYFISPENWNQGYAAEALQAAIDELFRMGFERVRTGFFEENKASCRVMEKCGMHLIPDESVIIYRGISHKCFYCEIMRTG